MNGFYRRVKTATVKSIAHFIERKNVVWVNGGNWPEIKWDNIFCKPYWMSRLYSFKTIAIPELISMGCGNANKREHELEINQRNYWQKEYKGFNLWELSKVGVCASLECGELVCDFDERHIAIIKFYYNRVSSLIDGLLHYLKSNSVDIFFVSQGCTPMSRPVVEVARSMGINVIAVENSFLGNYIFVDNATGMIVNRHAASRLAGDFYKAIGLSDEKRELFRTRFFNEQKKKLSDHLSSNTNLNPKEISNKYRGTRKKIALFIGQVINDSSLIMDGGAFHSSVRLILRCIEYFKKKKDWRLVIRLHPKELNGICWANTPGFFGPPPGERCGPLRYDNITYRLLMEHLGCPESDDYIIIADTSMPTYPLMDAADIGITINSQAGFEMAMKYKRVVVCGDAFYARKGFTYDVNLAESLNAVLNSAIENSNMSEQEKYYVDQYGYYLLNRFLFRRDMKGCWSRFIHLLEGCSQMPRKAILERAVREMEMHSTLGMIFSEGH